MKGDTQACKYLAIRYLGMLSVMDSNLQMGPKARVFFPGKHSSPVKGDTRDVFVSIWLLDIGACLALWIVTYEWAQKLEC